MPFHYSRVRLFFAHMDCFAAIASVLFFGGGITLLICGDAIRVWYVVLGTVSLFFLSWLSLLLALLTAKRGYVDSCTQIVKEAARNEVLRLLQKYCTKEAILEQSCQVTILAPRNGHVKIRKHLAEEYYLLGIISDGSKLIFETKGYSLVSDKQFHGTFRTELSHIADCGVISSKRHYAKAGLFYVKNAMGEELFTCRVRLGHDAEDLTSFVCKNAFIHTKHP